MPFPGRMPDGTAIHRRQLRTPGFEVSVIEYGAIITAIRIEHGGRPLNVVLGHDELDPYLDDPNYLGAVAGRYANRIARGRFGLDGTRHQLDTNDGAHHLHGGTNGYSRRAWQVESADATSLLLSLADPDRSGGYPGEVRATVTYSLAGDRALRIDYSAEASAATIINLTQHSYFNLSGDSRRTIDDHVLAIAADRYTPVDAQLIPTGEVVPVAGTPFDFRTPHPIGSATYDHNWVLNGPAGTLRQVARLEHQPTGLAMEVLTTEPGLQFYSGHLLKVPRTGLCLETQHFPDSPNHPAFPPVILRPGERYASTTIYRFVL